MDGDPASASVFDAGLFLFHNAREQLERGATPALYLPKLEAASEAAIWNDALSLAEDLLGVPRGTVRVTVLTRRCRPLSRWTRSSARSADARAD